MSDKQLEWLEAEMPIGTSVLYVPLLGRAEFERTKIRSKPWRLGSGTIVFKVEGRAGGVHHEHLTKLEPAP